MFDTLHAKSDPHPSPGGLADPEDDPRTTWDFSTASAGSEKKKKKKTKSRCLRTLAGVKGHLLTAWALALSLGGATEGHQYLFTHTVRLVLRLAALLHHTAAAAATGRDATGGVSQLFDAFLTFLPWDALHPSGAQSRLGSVVELTRKLAHLLASPPPDVWPGGDSGSRFSSQSITGALCVVRQAADGLDRAYTLQQRRVWASAAQGSGEELRCSDVYRVPLLQDVTEGRAGFTNQSLPVPQRPSSR